jgi:hypothetical protein
MESKDALNNIKVKSIEILNHRMKDTKIIYLIEITLNNNQSVLVNERYSELLNLHELMSKEAKLPVFPPKKYFHNKDEFFLQQRQNDLNSYYKTITSSDKFLNLTAFKSWINSKFKGVNIKQKEKFEYYEITDNNFEADRQKMIENEIKENIIPLFIDITEESNKKNRNSICEQKYYNLIKSEIFPFVENEPYSFKIEGNNTNFNFIGTKKSNFIKIEKLFNNKLIEMNKNINSEYLENYKTPELSFSFDI